MRATQYQQSVEMHPKYDVPADVMVAMAQAAAAHAVLGKMLEAGHTEMTVVVKDPGSNGDGTYSVWACGYAEEGK